MFPPSPNDWLPEDHLVYFILDVVQVLNLHAIESVIHARDARGKRPYSPHMMTALLVYAYCTGVYSSRAISKATYENVAFRVLTGGQHPHFTRINAFRKNHLEAFQDLFKQVLMMCQKTGLVKLGHVALDGTKIQGNASKHKAMSYAHIKKLEEKLETEIEQLILLAEEADDEEDKRLGKGQAAVDIPEELAHSQSRLERLKEARAELEESAKKSRAKHHRQLADGCEERAADPETSERMRKNNQTRAEKHRKRADELDPPSDDEDDQDPPGTTARGLPLHQTRTLKNAKPHPKAQQNFTDPDSRLMGTGGSFLQGYNAQAVVDSESQVIIGAAITNQPPDARNLSPMLDVVEDNLGVTPDAISADTGYWTPGVTEDSRQRGTEPYIATERKRHWERDHSVNQGPPPDELDEKQKMQWKLRTKEGRDLYAQRKAIVEPVFGQIKEARGFRRFSLRGLKQVAGEWDLIAMTHNLLKLFRSGAPIPATT